jgi:hypothetical protein
MGVQPWGAKITHCRFFGGRKNKYFFLTTRDKLTVPRPGQGGGSIPGIPQALPAEILSVKLISAFITLTEAK